MTEIPAESYETGRLTVGDEDFYAAEELVRAYHANRSICLRKQYLQNIYRIVFVVMLVPLACYFISEFFQPSISPYMAIISTVYTVFALFFVFVRRGVPSGRPVRDHPHRHPGRHPLRDRLSLRPGQALARAAAGVPRIPRHPGLS